MPVTSLTNSTTTGKRALDSDLQNGKRVRFSEEKQIYETFQKGILGIDGENARQSKDFIDRHILKMAAQTKYQEGSEEQMEAIRTALTSTVSMDITVINHTLDTLEKNLTNPNAKRRYINLLSTFSFD